MTAYLILGAGEFGRLAVRRLTAADPHARLTVVDRRSSALAAAHLLNSSGLTLVEAEAISWLAAHLHRDAPWDWLVPMIPEHVAFGWLRQAPLARPGWETEAVPEKVASLTAVAHRGPEGELFLSRAAHLCPDDCLEPASACPVTGESREPALFEALAAVELPGLEVLVIPCRQLAPGVGGYPPGDLLKAAECLPGDHQQVLVGTACRCHGVVHALRRRATGS